MVRCFILAAAAALLLGSTVRAEESSQKTTIQAGYGTVTLGGVQWQRFSFRPDIPIGRFGIGLDLELFIDSEGKISDEAWDFSSTSRTWDTLLRKIYYIRYGEKSDLFHIRAGALDDVTLGYGLIMDGYRNTLNYPGDKKLGLEFGVSDIGTFGLGVEGMMNSFGDLRNKGAVVGVRVSARPLKPSAAPLLSKLTFGATIVRDINQFAGLKDSDDDGYPDFEDGFPDNNKLWLDTDRDGITDYTEKNGVRTYVDPDADGDGLTDTTYGIQGFDNNVTYAQLINTKHDKNGVTVWGLDTGVPILDGPVRLDVYGQYAKIHTGEKAIEGGWGTAAPGVQLAVSRFLGRLEYRHFEGPFRPKYFDNLYENERMTLVGKTPITKDAILPDMTLNGVYGMARYNFFDFVSAEATYQDMTGNRTYQDLTGKVKVLDRVLEHIPKITIAEGYFYNTYVDTDTYDLLDITGNTLYGTRLGFSLTQGLTIVWDTRYTFTPNGRGGFERHRFVGIETVMTVR
jgi:hypothetical protein